MTDGFDYGKYIWQIQFYDRHPVRETERTSATIDYINQNITIRSTDFIGKTESEKTYLIDDTDFEKLLGYSEIQKIRDFEALPDTVLKDLEIGYRDGTRLYYSYFTHDDPPRTDGMLGAIYKGNPIEDIISWADNIHKLRN